MWPSCAIVTDRDTSGNRRDITRLLFEAMHAG
jgi:hypothetical protein